MQKKKWLLGLFFGLSWMYGIWTVFGSFAADDFSVHSLPSSHATPSLERGSRSSPQSGSSPEPKLQEGGQGRIEPHLESHQHGNVDIISYTVANYETKLHYDKRQCRGYLLVSPARHICAAFAVKRFSKDPKREAEIREKYGPSHLRVQLRGPEVIMGNVTFSYERKPSEIDCTYTASFFLSRRGIYHLSAQVVFEDFNAVNELVEKTWYPYAMKMLTPRQATIQCETDSFTPQGELNPCSSTVSPATTQSQEAGRWVDSGKETLDFRKAYPGYWLSIGKFATPLNAFEPDLLGRMEFGRTYRWEPYSCRHNQYSKEKILQLLRNRKISFFGDSHMRITFYGTLARLGVSFPHNKVWKGDRTDRIESHNATISFVASYFMNTTRPTALAMLKAGGYVVAGVGQHHASGCWSVEKHRNAVEVCDGTPRGLGFHTALPQVPSLLPPLRRQMSRVALIYIKSCPSTQEAMQDFDKYKAQVIWFGIPAHTMNRHMRVAQQRTDCRNNLRHKYVGSWTTPLVPAILKLYESSVPIPKCGEICTSGDGARPEFSPVSSCPGVVHHLINRILNEVQFDLARKRNYPIVDIYNKSFPMIHTSPDGAHYYNWVREAWVDDIFAAVDLLNRERSR